MLDHLIKISLKFYETEPWHHFARGVFFKIALHTVDSPWWRCADMMKFLLVERILLTQLKSEGELICVILKINETIVKQESCIALLTIWVKDLLASLDIMECINHKTLPLVTVVPWCLPGPFMVQHISISNKGVSIMITYLNAEDSWCYHHPVLTVLLKGELLEFGNLVTNEIIVWLDIFYFLSDLCLERTSIQPLTLFCSVENWEISKALWQNINVCIELWVGFPPLLH